MEQLRASQITIDMPKPDGLPWIQITVQKVIRAEDYSITNIITRWQKFSIPLSDIISEQYPVSTDSNDVVTGYELFNSIYTLVVLELQKRYGGQINEQMDLIL